MKQKKLREKRTKSKREEHTLTSCSAKAGKTLIGKEAILHLDKKEEHKKNTREEKEEGSENENYPTTSKTQHINRKDKNQNTKKGNDAMKTQQNIILEDSDDSYIIPNLTLRNISQQKEQQEMEQQKEKREKNRKKKTIKETGIETFWKILDLWKDGKTDEIWEELKKVIMNIVKDMIGNFLGGEKSTEEGSSLDSQIRS